MAPFKCLLPVCAVIVSGSVQAADLPVLKAAPVEYVRICSTHGAGFFYVPGTDSCLRISARFRADFRYLEPFTRARDSIGTRARGRINFDHRTTTVRIRQGPRRKAWRSGTVHGWRSTRTRLTRRCWRSSF